MYLHSCSIYRKILYLPFECQVIITLSYATSHDCKWCQNKPRLSSIWLYISDVMTSLTFSVSRKTAYNFFTASVLALIYFRQGFGWNCRTVVFALSSLFFRENKTRYIMWILCKADDSHEISSLIFLRFDFSCESSARQTIHINIKPYFPKTWYFTWILCKVEDSHKTSSLIFFKR